MNERCIYSNEPDYNIWSPGDVRDIDYSWSCCYQDNICSSCSEMVQALAKLNMSQNDYNAVQVLIPLIKMIDGKDAAFIVAKALVDQKVV